MRTLLRTFDALTLVAALVVALDAPLVALAGRRRGPGVVGDVCDGLVMSNELVKSLGGAALELAPAPVKAVAVALQGLLGRPDLFESFAIAVQDDVGRLRQQLGEVVSSLSDEVRAKIDPVEAMELTMQTVANMGRTARQEKRQRLANVLVNGLREPWDGARLRLLERLADQLEEEHIEVLQRKASRTRKREAREESPSARRERQAVADALERELIAFGLLAEDDKAERKSRSVSISALGELFLAFVKDPDAPAEDEEEVSRAQVEKFERVTEGYRRLATAASERRLDFSSWVGPTPKRGEWPW